MANSEFADPDDPIIYLYMICALLCVTCAALAAGLTLGILSLDPLKLQIKMQVGSDEDKKAAAAILPLLEDRHLLLCTLLLYNSIANEALPIFMDELVPAYIAVLISVTLVLLAGEVMPAAVFTGPHQLQLAKKMTGLVYFLEFIFYPLAYPMARGLDWLLGAEEDDTLKRDELAVLMHITRQSSLEYIEKSHRSSTSYNDEESRKHVLRADEVNTITGVLSLAKKKVRDVMISMDKVYLLSSDQILDAATLATIDQIGHSRLPVFKGTDRNQILGYLLVKKLITINPEKETPLMEVELNAPLVVSSEQSLYDVLDLFQTGKAHLAIVSKNAALLSKSIAEGKSPTPDCVPLGIITIEDIFEEILQEEIYDEEDLKKNGINAPAVASVLKALTRKTSGAVDPQLAAVTTALQSASIVNPIYATNERTSSDVTLTGKNSMNSSLVTKFLKRTASNRGESNSALENDFAASSKQSLLPSPDDSYKPLDEGDQTLTEKRAGGGWLGGLVGGSSKKKDGEDFFDSLGPRDSKL